MLLLMGDSGLRIAEATAATRDQLQQLPADGDLPAIWQLAVVGKGSKARETLVSDTCAAAISAHWRDRSLDFVAAAGERLALVAPLAMPPTPNAIAKTARLVAGNSDETGGYSVRRARSLVVWALTQLRDDGPAQLPDLTEAERRQLARTSPHALRHTFGTQTVAAGVPLDVAQRVLGHASLQTTTVYVTAEQRHVRAELGRYFGKDKVGGKQ